MLRCAYIANFVHNEATSFDLTVASLQMNQINRESLSLSPRRALEVAASLRILQRGLQIELRLRVVAPSDEGHYWCSRH